MPPGSSYLKEFLLSHAHHSFLARHQQLINECLVQVVTSAGAEALPFLASFCVLPASFAFFFAYGRLIEILPQRAVFYASVIPLVTSRLLVNDS